jgi:delta8-fatty-acid desaturase
MVNPRIFTRREIEGLIAGGDDIVLFEGAVLRLNAWKDKHPGGKFVIQHMVGRDATDEMNM